MRRSSWLVLLPRRLPALSLMLEDIGSPSSSVVAKALGVCKTTVERWRRKDHAPRPAMLALYYATQWGRSEVNCQAENDASLYFAYAGALRTELDAANAKLARVGQIGDFGSANDPAPGVPATLRATPPTLVKKPRKKTTGQQQVNVAEKLPTKRANRTPPPFGGLRTG